MNSQLNSDSVFEYDFEFSQKDVETFAKATGDNNPIHLDEEYASSTPFKKRILHGFMGGSVFSKVFGTMFPGEGTIYLKQDMSFKKPMYADEKYKAVFTVIELFPEKHRALVKTEILDDSKDIVTTGEALIWHKSIN